MSSPISNLSELIQTMAPKRHEGVYVFASLPRDLTRPPIDYLATFQEPEGITVIVREADAQRFNWPILFRATWITLTVHSDLNAVGFTAAIATALAKSGISCNVVAAAYHDHLFVPVQQAQDALDCLERLKDSKIIL